MHTHAPFLHSITSSVTLQLLLMMYRLAVHLMFAAKGFLAVYSEFALRFGGPGGCGAVEYIIL